MKTTKHFPTQQRNIDTYEYKNKCMLTKTEKKLQK